MFHFNICAVFRNIEVHVILHWTLPLCIIVYLNQLFTFSLEFLFWLLYILLSTPSSSITNCRDYPIVEITQQIHVSPKVEHNEKITKILDSSSTKTLSLYNVNIFTTVKLMDWCLWKKKYKTYFDWSHYYSLYYTRIS